MSEFGKEVEDYFCRFTFGQFVTLILLELVTLFFVFYLGARYGPDLIGGRKEVATQAAVEAPPPVDYSFPEALSDKEGGAIKIKPSGMTAREYEERQRVVIPLPEEIPVPPPAAPIKIKEAPEKPVPAASKKGGAFSVQVGSYQTAEEAARMVDKWKQKGYQTIMTVGEIPNKGVWYRVRIGQFKDRDEAKIFLQKFKTREKADGLVVSTRS